MGKPRCQVKKTANISSTNPNYNCHYNTNYQPSWKSKLQGHTQHTYFTARRLSNFAGSISAAVLMLLLTMLILPTVDTGVSATDNWAQVATTFNAKVNPSISVSVPSSFNLNLVPSSQSTFAVADGKVAVMTNNASGYRLLIQSTTGSNLVSRDNSSEQAITSIISRQTEAEFENNTWGYYLGSAAVDSSSVYQPVSTTATEAIKTTGLSDTANTAYYNLAFGTKIAASLPAGTYSNAIIVSAVANPMEIHSLMDLTFMQDITSSVCESTPSAYSAETNTTDTSSEYYKNPVSKQLIDIRDGKSYWVAKLADGNCWMTQNLALDLDPTKTLTSADTDLPSGESWTPEVGTNEVAFLGKPVVNGFTDYSWKPNSTVLVTPLQGTICVTYGSPNSITSSDILGETCKSAGIIDVSGSDWQPTFTAQMGDYKYDANTNNIVSEPNSSGTTFIAADTNTRTYDPHYLIGTYYQQKAATAGKGGGTTATNKVVEASICPRGWRLPASGRDSDGYPLDIAKSFYKLALAYGYTNATEYKPDNYKNAFRTMKTPKINLPENLAAPPISFTRSGVIDYATTGYLRYAGSVGDYWSNTETTNGGFAFDFNAGAFAVSFNYARSTALSIRCIAH